MFGPLGLSLAPYIKQSRFWNRILTPFSKWYADAAGYRRMGLKYDDLCKMILDFFFQFRSLGNCLVLEERPDVQKVIIMNQLPPKEKKECNT